MATPGVNASTGYQLQPKRQHLGRINTNANANANADLNALHSDSSDSLSPRLQEGPLPFRRPTTTNAPAPPGGPGAGAHEHEHEHEHDGGEPLLGNQPLASSSRAGGSSPTLSRRGHSPLLPSFGFGFSSTHKPQKSTSTPAKRLVPRLLQSRSPLRNRLVAGLALVCLVLWTVWGKSKPTIARERLTTRWWDADAADQPPSLLPRPSMLPKPPKRKPPALTSHSLAVLARLPTTFVAATPPEWTAVIHLSSSSQLATISKLLKSILRQSVPPARVLLLAPDGLAPSTAKHGPSVSLLSYPTARAPAVAIVLAAGSIPTTHAVIIDANLELVKSSYVRTLLRAAGTSEYGSALLSAGGLVLPVSAASRPATCLVSDGSGESLENSAAIHAPSTPFLIETAWLAPLSNGLRTDVPLEVGLALALWTKLGIPSFGLPVPWDEGRRDWGCERLKRAVSGSEAQLGALFRRELSPPSTGPARGQSFDGADSPATDGTVVLLLSGDAELELAHPLACGFAQDHDVRVYVADSESAAQGPTVFFPSPDAPSGGPRCHLDIRPLGTGAKGESVQLAVLQELDKVTDVEVVVYLVDGYRGREFGEAMHWSEAQFAVRMGGARRGRRRTDDEGGTVAIALTKADIVHSEWISALPMEALRHWHTPKIDITVITNDRPASLNRLLTALQDAHFFGDEVSLSLNLEQTADRATQRLVDDFQWGFGPVTLRHRIILGGLMPAIVESWYPASNDSYGVFLEDDVEVSPMFYSWLKFTILHYRYYTPMRERSTRLFGVSLYQQRNIELRPEGRQPFDAHKLFASLSMPATLPYLSQIPCSWGAAYFPEVWREFHAYLALRLSETALPISDSIVPEIRSNKWPRSWKKYFIELVYMRGYVMLYPNYDNFASFSTNHLEKGTHIHVATVDEKRKRQFDVPLMGRNGSILALPEARLPHWDALPVIDLWGALASDDDLVERGWQSVAQLDTCPPFRLDILPTYNARELLCAKVYDRTNVLVEAQPLAATTRDGESASDALRERPPLVDHPDREADDADVAEHREDRSDASERERLRDYARARQRVMGQRGQDRVDDDSIGVHEDDDAVAVVAEVPTGQEAAIIEREDELTRPI